MLYFVIGLPGAFMRWCENTVVRLLPDAKILRANNPADVTRGLVCGDATNTVVVTVHPSGRLRAALLESGHPFIVISDDPRRVLADITARGKCLIDAIRIVASGCATVSDSKIVSNGLVLSADAVDIDVAHLEAMIVRHLQLPSKPIGMIVPREATIASDFSHWWEELDVGERALVGDAIGGYMVRDPQHPLRLVWRSALFDVEDAPGSSADRLIDITGRARRLFSGPRIVLPQASWRLTLELNLIGASVEHTFLLEISAGHLLASRSIKPEREGAMAITLDFQVDDTADHPVDIAISLQKAAFDGLVALKTVTLVERRIES